MARTMDRVRYGDGGFAELSVGRMDGSFGDMDVAGPAPERIRTAAGLGLLDGDLPCVAGGGEPRETGRVPHIPPSVRELLATGPLVHVTTLDPDGTPHVTLAWAGFDGDDVTMATFFNLGQRKLENLRRDPRVVLSFHAKEYQGDGLWPYAVIQGRADRVIEGGALELMDRLAEFYIGPGQRHPMRDTPDGVVIRVTVQRVYGQGI